MTRLTEEQIAAMRPRYTEYPERILSAPEYPPARKKRGLKPEEQALITDPTQEGALPAGGLTGGPNTVLWGVFIYEDLANQGMQIGSQRFDGPGLLHSFTGQIDATAQGTTFDPLHITYSSSPIPRERGFTTPKMPPGTPIARLTVDQGSITPAQVSQSGLIFERDFGNNIVTIPIGVYIPLDSFYLGLGLFTRATVAFVYGSFRVIENAPPESIGWV